jgi:UDP-GlcNAc:undecaprenyl-phosphate GlcNAc-1-phosphate transferase
VGIALGICLSVSSLVLTGILSPLEVISLELMLPAFVFLILGLIDDILELRPASKFGLQVVAAGTAVALGNRCEVVGIGLVDMFLSAVWILTVVNAFNITDVCDGLLGGLAVVCFIFLAGASPNHSFMPVVFAGACLGFLLLNRPPASIFLGDAGSHLLGFLAAGLSLKLLRPNGLWPQMGQLVLLIGVPLFEVLFTASVRIHKRIPWWKGSSDHFSLRLQAAGFSAFQTDLLAWGDAAILGTAAIWLKSISSLAQVGLLAALLLTHLLFALQLLRWEVPQIGSQSGV